MSLKICSEVIVRSKELPFLKARETNFSMSLSYTDIMMGVRCDNCVAWMRMPRKWRRRPASREKPDLILIVHLTAEVLSQKKAAWVWERLGVIHSSTIQFLTSPFISRLSMVRVPNMKSSFTCQIIGPILFVPDV